jgi:hypothetical protein
MARGDDRANGSTFSIVDYGASGIDSFSIGFTS